MPERLAPQFVEPAQQEESARLGMWLFLGTEVLFFGGLIAAYVVYRVIYPREFADGSRRLVEWIGAVNTAVLLTSSLTMAWGVRAAREGRARAAAVPLAATAVLGAAFLVLKAFEYHEDFEEGVVPVLRFLQPAGKEELFFILYFLMTLLHALHLTIGIGVVGTIAARARRGEYSRAYHTPVAVAGLYWHFVDVVWIFLFPLLYLIDRRPSP
jgi:cytochrome c oxidase subunit 3